MPDRENIRHAVREEPQEELMARSTAMAMTADRRT